VDWSTLAPDDLLPDQYLSDVSAFVTIMRGCDNYCTYCVVPYSGGASRADLRGRFSPRLHLVSQGSEVLAGQNVNSYGLKEGHCNFSQLPGEGQQNRWIGSHSVHDLHPKDLSLELMEAFGGLKTVPHIHLPVQFRLEPVLKRMNAVTAPSTIWKRSISSGGFVRISPSPRNHRGIPRRTEEDFAAPASDRASGLTDFLLLSIGCPMRRPCGSTTRLMSGQERAPAKSLGRQNSSLPEKQPDGGAVYPVLVDGLSKHLREEIETRPPGPIFLTTSGPAAPEQQIVHFLHDQPGIGRIKCDRRIVAIMIERAMSPAFGAHLQHAHRI